MAYQVTYTKIYKVDAPAYDEWATNLDTDTLEDLAVSTNQIPRYLEKIVEYRRLVGTKTPHDVITDNVEKILDPGLGFVSSDMSNDSNTVILIEDWESATSYESAQKLLKVDPATGTITCQENSVTVNGTDTLFLTEVSINDDIYVTTNNETAFLGTVSSIESNTVLTLAKANGITDLTDFVFSIYENQFCANFLVQVYNALYVESTEIVKTEI